MLDRKKCLKCNYRALKRVTNDGNVWDLCTFDPSDYVFLDTIEQSLVLRCPLEEDLAPANTPYEPTHFDNTKCEKCISRAFRPTNLKHYCKENGKYINDLTTCPLDELKGEKMNVVDKIGEAALLEQTAEECVELAKELLKLARKIRNENPTPTKLKTIKKHLWEETADVLLCLDILDDAGFIPQEEVMGIYREKEARMKKRLGEE